MYLKVALFFVNRYVWKWEVLISQLNLKMYLANNSSCEKWNENSVSFIEKNVIFLNQKLFLHKSFLYPQSGSFCTRCINLYKHWAIWRHFITFVWHWHSFRLFLISCLNLFDFPIKLELDRKYLIGIHPRNFTTSVT